MMAASTIRDNKDFVIMSKRMLLTMLGYSVFVVIPFIYMLMTVHHLLTTEMNPITRIAAAETQVDRSAEALSSPQA